MGLLDSVFGKSKGKAAVSSISNTITSVVSSTVQSCEVSAYQTQQVNIENTGLWFWGTARVEQKSDISVNCFSNKQLELDLQNRIANTIANSATASGTALWPAFGSTKAVATTNITNVIHNNVSLSNIQSTYMSIRQEQNVNFKNSGVMIFSGVELSQGSQLFAAATLSELDKIGIFNQIENYVDQSADATVSGPFDWLITAMTILLIIVVLVAGVLGGVWIYRSKNSQSKLTEYEATAAEVPSSV